MYPMIEMGNVRDIAHRHGDGVSECLGEDPQAIIGTFQNQLFP